MFSRVKLTTVRTRHTFLWYNLADSKRGLWCSRKDAVLPFHHRYMTVRPLVHHLIGSYHEGLYHTTEFEIAPWQQLFNGYFPAQALIQSKTVDPGQVFLLLFFVFCLFYSLESSHVSPMKRFQQLHDQCGIATDTCPDKSSASVSSWCLSRWPGRFGTWHSGRSRFLQFSKSLNSWPVSVENLLEMPAFCSILTKGGAQARSRNCLHHLPSNSDGKAFRWYKCRVITSLLKANVPTNLISPATDRLLESTSLRK